MKKLSLASLLVALTNATGCIIIADDTSGSVIEVSFDLVDRGDVVTCALKNATTIRVVATDSFGVNTTTDFPCASPGTGQVDPLPLDDYHLSVALLDGTGATIGGPVEYDIILGADGEIVTVGPVHFDFSRYDVTFNADYGNAGGENCTATAGGGSGVAQQRVEVVREGDGACTPFTLNVTMSVLGSQTTCNTTEICQESSGEPQTVQGMPPGNYTLTLRGLKGNTSAETFICYRGSESFNLPNNNPSDFTLDSVVAPFLLNTDSEYDVRCEAKM